MLIGDCGVLQRVYDEKSKVLRINTETLKIIDQFDEEQNLISRTFENTFASGSSTTIEYPIGDLLVNEHRQLDDQGRVINYNGYTCSYDDQGRLIQKTSSKQVFNYNYDELDRLVKVAVDGKTIEYTYDIIGRRLTKAITVNGETNKEYYLYQGVNQIGVYNEFNKPIHLRALGIHFNEHLPLAIAIESNDQTYAPIFNSNFNMVQLLDIATKEVFDYQNLSPFGDNLQDLKPVCPWIFATKHYDEDTGLVDFGNRQYDPTIKQWTSKDNDPRATVEDFYSYCNNYPLKYIDPDGKFAFFVFIPLTLGWKAVAVALGIGALTAGAKVAADRGAKNINNKDLALMVGGIGGYLAGVAVNKVINMPFPDRDLPRDEKTDEPLPDVDCPHTQLGWRKGKYPQAREFDENGKPIKDIDFTDHDRPQNHPCPHQHPYNENDTGGTKQRGKVAEIVPGWDYSNE